MIYVPLTEPIPGVSLGDHELRRRGDRPELAQQLPRPEQADRRSQSLKARILRREISIMGT
jgi:hypothetical protein